VVALVALAALAVLSGCGGGLRHSVGAEASADVVPADPGSCEAAALAALGHVAVRVYREGIYSERTVSASRMIESSAPLRTAVEAGDASAARRAAQALLATGHMTNLRVVRSGKVLVDLGGSAVTPLNGVLTGATGRPIARFVTSVWADSGLVAETDGIAEGVTVVRTQPGSGAGRTLTGTFGLPSGKLPVRGTLTRGGKTYAYTSYAANAYPGGDPLRVYVLRSVGSLSSLCGASSQETTVNTLTRIARLIYLGEAGKRTGAQVRRVQRYQPLLQAVARRDPVATRAAVATLLHHHIVRLRISAGGRLLSDLGGPFVLAPVRAPLRLGGRELGSLLLSIQDDEGYKRLAQRLVGLDVLMYMGPRLVKSTLGFGSALAPGSVPANGPFGYRGKSYRTYTFDGQAFPSGPLRITVLIPIPYS
jgi:hypothetical protein